MDQPTQASLIERMRQGFRAKLPNSDAWIFPNNLWIAATVVGGMLWELYAQAVKILKQAMPDTATGVWLQRWANLFRVYIKMPQPATGPVAVTGTASTLIPAGTLFSRSDGTQYATQADVVLDATGIGVVTVTATTTGASTNALASEPLSLMSSVSGLDSEALVGTAGLGGGADIETDDDLRARLLARMARRNRYGTLQDYVDWALEVPGVTRAWAFAYGNVIKVYFMMDYAYPTTYGIPQQTDVLIVQAYLTNPCRKPIGAVPVASLPAGVPLGITIRCPTPFNATIQSAVESDLDSYLIRTASPGRGYTAQDLQRVIDAAALFDYTVGQSTFAAKPPAQIFTHVVVDWETC
ncbi:baseplate J-like family protein [Burkholderia sp. MSHR3999]|uniref:baseplate J/gp47 family protein n=1 Tax=Burkholderia sp. MSHR3999 TaxID=1542965 RepID=UPI0005B71852|nr:baseplate J/gp47 family protein [Burkholderia sp. MSHR3999]KIP13337.1 baseplate J-like family protein [Burkholderia sp. MSHR3999]